MSRFLVSGLSVDGNDNGYHNVLLQIRSFGNKLHNYNDSIYENEHVKDNQNNAMEKGRW